MSQAAFDLDGHGASDEAADPTFTVAGLAEAINAALRGHFPGGVWVRGEIQGWREGRNGHAYFDLADDDEAHKATIAVQFFVNVRNRLRPLLARHGLRLGDGIKVRIQAIPDLWAPTGRLGLKMIGIDPRYTLGEIALARDELIRRLIADGAFDAQRRLVFPLVPLRVGVVSSVGSAAWHDFSEELFSSGIGFQLTVCDVRVQGDGAEEMVAAAIRTLDRRLLDTIVVVRGGGSRADLAVFDGEPIARAIAASRTPVLTGLGHEIDRSVADEIAHRALKTPTACAIELIAAVEAFRRRTEQAWAWISAISPLLAERHRRRLEDIGERIAGRTRLALGVAGERLDGRQQRLGRAARHSLGDRQRRIERAAGQLGAEARRRLTAADVVLTGLEGRVRLLDPAAALARGWSLTRRADGSLVRSISDVHAGDELSTLIHQGEIMSVVRRAEGNR